MTTLTNGLVYRGLVTEMIPLEAWEKLPGKPNSLIRESVGVDGKQSVQDYVTPMDVGDLLENRIRPYKSIDALTNWYEASLNGLASALGAMERVERKSSCKKQWERKFRHKYFTAAMQLNQVYIDTLIALTAEKVQEPISEPSVS